MTRSATFPFDATREDPVASPRLASVETVTYRLVTAVQRIDATTDFAQLTAGLHRTPFQSPGWLATWFATFADGASPDHPVEGFWLSITRNGLTVLAMPLVRRREGRLVVLEIPDQGVTDFAAPLLAGEAILAAHSGTELWSLILSALPEADLLRLDRTPATIDGIANPLVEHPAALPSRISGWARALPDDRTAFSASLSGSMREKLRKCTRRFAGAEGSRIARVRDPQTLPDHLATLSRWQAERMDAKGRSYELDEPRIASFYRKLAEDGLASGDVMIMELAAEGQSLALNYSYRDRETVVFLRTGNEFGKWAPFALGILATESVIEDSIRSGIRSFNFGAGDYEYKLRFGGERMPLYDIVLPLTLAGLPHVLALQVRRRLAGIAWLRRAVENVRRMTKRDA